MRRILSIEKPDLVVLTGDMITGNNIVDNASTYWYQMVEPMIELDIRWAITFGNHDDLSTGKQGSREALLKYDMSFPLSVSLPGPPHIHGLSNYILEIYSSELNEIRFLLFLFDSNDECIQSHDENGRSGCIHPDQVEWYRQQTYHYLNKTNCTLPALAFFHIPLQEYMELWNNHICFGTNNDSVACQSTNCGLFAAFLERGNVRGVFVGHNHGNDYCGELNGIQLCYGRHSGYGGYGNWERGARIIEIYENKSLFNTWIRFESDRKENKGILHKPTYSGQTECY